MSRSGYTDDMDDDLAMGRWRAQVASATRGKRGQKMLTDLLAALDAMPRKELIVGELEEFNPEDGRLEVCALGALCHARGIDMQKLDPSEPEEIAAVFDIAPQLAQEIVYMNDEYFDFEYVDNVRMDITPEKRWQKMRDWVSKQIKTVGASTAPATPKESR